MILKRSHKVWNIADDLKAKVRVPCGGCTQVVNGAGPRVSSDKSAAEPDHCDMISTIKVCVGGRGSPVNICWGKILCFGKPDQLKMLMRASVRGGDYDQTLY